MVDRIYKIELITCDGCPNAREIKYPKGYCNDVSDDKGHQKRIILNQFIPEWCRLPKVEDN